MADLNNRSRKILQAVVQEFLHTGDAVGSRTVTRRYGIDLSPATVRNVMSDLEELGLLRQPHTSAGRVPTNEGLRFFIDSLLKVRSLSLKEQEEIRLRYDLDSADLDDVLQRTSKARADLSHQAVIVISPVPERQRLDHIEFVKLRDNQILAVLVVHGGQVENRLLKFELPPDPGFLDRASNCLNELASGLTLEEIRHRVLEELGKQKNQVDDLVCNALKLGQVALSGSSSPDVIVSGQAHLLESHDGEAPDLDKVRALLGALEEKETVVRLLDRTLDADGIQVWLGADTPFSVGGDLSVVAAKYGPEDRPVGSIAVIGPTRMNYSKVIPLVDFTAELVSGMIGSRR